MKIYDMMIPLSDFEHAMLLKKFENDIAIRGFIQRAIDKAVANEAAEIDWSGKYDTNEETA